METKFKIFNGTQGSVAVIEADADEKVGVPFLFQVDAKPFNIDVIRGILTSVVMNHEINAQFMHSLNDTIYINVFGNKMGQMTLSGILFLSDVCVGTNKNTEPPFEKFYDYYINNNALSRPSSLKIQIGTGGIFQAFIISFTFQIVDPQTALGQFSMTLAVVPKTN